VQLIKKKVYIWKLKNLKYIHNKIFYRFELGCSNERITVIDKNDYNEYRFWKCIVPNQATFAIEEVKYLLYGCVILLCHGGYFAGSVFVNGTCISHKTIHKYMPVNNRQDDAKYSDNKFANEITEQLQKWKENIASATLVFVHAPGKNNRFFNSIEVKTDHIPFSTNQPNYKEVIKTYNRLSTTQFSEELLYGHY